MHVVLFSKTVTTTAAVTIRSVSFLFLLPTSAKRLHRRLEITSGLAGRVRVGGGRDETGEKK